VYHCRSDRRNSVTGTEGSETVLIDRTFSFIR
jgi:hypothetical protein